MQALNRNKLAAERTLMAWVRTCLSMIGFGFFISTCTILTTTPNQLLADIHDRMPVILPSASYDLWLDPGFRDLAATSEMLKPYDAGQMRRYPVSPRVNSVANDDLQCSQPIEVSRVIQAGLF